MKLIYGFNFYSWGPTFIRPIPTEVIPVIFIGFVNADAIVTLPFTIGAFYQI